MVSFAPGAKLRAAGSRISAVVAIVPEMQVGPTNPHGIIAGVILAVAFASLAGCQQSGDRESPGQVHNTATNGSVAGPLIPRPDPPLDRAALLSAIAQSASLQAIGERDVEAQRVLDGKPFELRIRFGCGGPLAALGRELLGWSYEAEKGTLRVRATPTISKQDAVAAQIAGDEIEAVEGFWLARPWLLQPACPATAAIQSATAAPPETASASPVPPKTAPGAVEEQGDVQPSVGLSKFGIAEFFTEADSRTQRRAMRPYEAVKTVEPNQPIRSQGFNLVLSGRLRALPDKRVIACASNDPDRPPHCIVSAQFDRVWIERPDNGETVAEWGGS